MKNVAQSNQNLRLYGLTHYDRSAKVRWLLTELNLKFENIWLNREKKENEGPHFLQLNPLGRVPVLELNHQAIFESGAICAYLSDLYLDKKMAPSLDSPERAQYQQWMYFSSATLDVFQIRIMLIEDIPAGDYQVAKERALQSDLKDALAALSSVLSQNSFLVGNQLSTADICVSFHLYWLSFWPELEVVMKDFPCILDYLERMKKVPSAISAQVFSYSE